MKLEAICSSGTDGQRASYQQPIRKLLMAVRSPLLNSNLYSITYSSPFLTPKAAKEGSALSKTSLNNVHLLYVFP